MQIFVSGQLQEEVPVDPQISQSLENLVNKQMLPELCLQAIVMCGLQLAYIERH